MVDGTQECPECGTLLALGARTKHMQWHAETDAPPGEPEKAGNDGQGE